MVEIGAADGPVRGRIVFEDKDEQLSKNRAWAELNGAMAERDADFAVLVVAGEERIPSGREQLHEYEGNKLIIAVDREEPDEIGLELAYRYARCRVLMARDHTLEVDAGGVRDAAEAARAALKRANSVRLALTNIDKSSEKAREGVEAIVADVEADLTRIESLVAAAAEAEADDGSGRRARRLGQQQVVLRARPVGADRELAAAGAGAGSGHRVVALLERDLQAADRARADLVAGGVGRAARARVSTRRPTGWRS